MPIGKAMTRTPWLGLAAVCRPLTVGCYVLLVWLSSLASLVVAALAAALLPLVAVTAALLWRRWASGTTYALSTTRRPASALKAARTVADDQPGRGSASTNISAICR